MIENKKLIPICSLALISLIVIGAFAYFGIKQTTLTDEDIIFSSSKSIRDSNSLKVDNSLNKDLDTCLITSYMYSLDKDKNLFFNINPTTAIFYAYLVSILGESAFFYSSLFFTILILIFVYLLSYKFSKSEVFSLLILLPLLFFGVFFKLIFGYYDILPTVLFLLISLFLILNQRRSIYYLLSGIFFSLAISIRLSEAIYSIPFLLLIFFNRNNRKKHLLMWVLPPIILLLSMFLINSHFYGDPFYISKAHSTFYPCYSNEEYNSQSNTHAFIELIRYFYHGNNPFTSMFNHLIYFFKANFLFLLMFPLFFLSIFKICKEEKWQYLLFFIITLVFSIFLYGKGNNYFGFLEMNFQSSFLRYALFPTILTLPPIALFFKEFSKKARYTKIIVLILIIIICFSSVVFVYNYPKNGIKNYNIGRNEIIYIRDNLVSTIEPNNFIITTFYTDKIISKDFKNVISPTKYYTNDQIPREEIDSSMINLINKLISKKEKVMFLFNSYFDDTEVISILKKKYKLILINEAKGVELYEVNQK